MFYFIMLDMITCNCYSRCIVTIQIHRMLWFKTQIDRTFHTHKSSHIPSVMPLNSALALDLISNNCFLLLQVTRFPQQNVKYSEVGLQSLSEPIQSVSDEGMTTPNTMETLPRRITRSMTKGETFPSLSLFRISLVWFPWSWLSWSLLVDLLTFA